MIFAKLKIRLKLALVLPIPPGATASTALNPEPLLLTIQQVVQVGHLNHSLKLALLPNLLARVGHIRIGVPVKQVQTPKKEQ